MKKLSIAIHGGAGTILREEMSSDLEKNYSNALQDAIDRGYSILEKGGSAIQAVKAAVINLEDNILFNAGKGSVFTNQGLHEMDAAIMDGSNLMAGAVAGVKNIRNPIELAEAIMLHSNHVLLMGTGAEEFAKLQGIRTEPDDYFYSKFRFDQWGAVKETGEYHLDHSTPSSLKEKKFGTVGAVACDAEGNIAAATSTGGMTNKLFGRIGDTPIIGSGTYANNRTCAISCTGHGEPFIRSVVAYDISCLMEYKGLSLEEACNEVVLKKLVDIKGEGGIIGMDAMGNVALVFNSDGMYRAYRSSDGSQLTAIYKVLN